MMRSCLRALICAALMIAVGDPCQAAIITLQPGAAGVKDTWIWDLEDVDHGSENELRVNRLSSFDQRMLVEFSDLSAIPTGATINSAFLKLYHFDGTATGTFIELGAFAITSAWSESVTYSTAPTFNPLADDVVTVPAGSAQVDGWIGWNIQTMVQQWVDGSLANNGTLIYNSGLTDSFFQRFASSDVGGSGDGPPHPGTAFTPILEIDFTASSSTVPEPGSLTLLGLGALGLFGGAIRRRRQSKQAV